MAQFLIPALFFQVVSSVYLSYRRFLINFGHSRSLKCRNYYTRELFWILMWFLWQFWRKSFNKTEIGFNAAKKFTCAEFQFHAGAHWNFYLCFFSRETFLNSRICIWKDFCECGHCSGSGSGTGFDSVPHVRWNSFLFTNHFRNSAFYQFEFMEINRVWKIDNIWLQMHKSVTSTSMRLLEFTKSY